MDVSTAASRTDDYPFMLGQGYDLSLANLWDFSTGLTPKPILDMKDLPKSCARADDSCSSYSKTQIKNFASVKEGFTTFQESSSINFDMKVYNFAASLNAAFGRSGGSSWFSETYGTMGWKIEVDRCHTLEQGCLKANHGDIKALPRFLKAIKNDTSLDTKGCVPNNLKFWETTVVEQYGTHMATQTRNGGMMRYQELASYSGKDLGQCMFDSVCSGMRLAGFEKVKANWGMCSNSTSCEGASSRDSSIEYKCVAVGGHDMSDLPDVQVSTGPTFSLASSHTSDMSSRCPSVGKKCFFAMGMEDCQQQCADEAECNVFAFCPPGASCTSGTNRCCLRKCDNDDLKLTHKWKGWDVYKKFDGCQAQYEEMAGHDVAQTTYTGSTDAEKDASCCANCLANPDCEFWVRSTTGSECWLKKGHTGNTNNSERRGAMRSTQVKNEAQTMCNSITSISNRDKFFEPTDDELNSDLTVVGMEFMPIEDLALAYGASYSATSTIQKAREYHMCKALPDSVWQWSTDDCSEGCAEACQHGTGCDKDSNGHCVLYNNGYHCFVGKGASCPSDVSCWYLDGNTYYTETTCKEGVVGGQGEGKCKCIRQCENGGTLDEDTCTCKCRGDEFHGWKGETCSETYGTCQAGAGTGNPDAARKCSDGGRCASWYHGYACKDTEVCCITDFYGTCCPFGSSCSCNVNKCHCLTPEESFVKIMTPPPAPTAGTYTQKDGVSCRRSKIQITKDGLKKTYSTFNLDKAKRTCDLLDECVGVMDNGCDGKGKYTLCEKSDKPFKEKAGHCIHTKENY